MNKFLIVAKREYLRMVRSKAFWLSTMLIPVMMIVVGTISGLSSKSVEQKLKNDLNSAKSIYLLDDSGMVDKEALKQTPGIVIPNSYDNGVAAVKSKAADVFIFYPKDILTSNKIEIFSQDKGIMALGMYDQVAKNLLKQNILAGIKDPQKIQLFNANLGTQTRLFNNGTEVPAGLERLVLPIASIFAFFLFTSISSSQLLMSVSEEKENRMIEVVLSVINPKDLIVGKVLGQVGAIMTQMVVLIALGLLALKASNTVIPIDLSQVNIAPGQILLAFTYILLGFLIMAFTMVGVGAAMPSYREANNFSAVFIMMSVIPIYFVTIILADPTAPLAIGLSYFPYTAPMILLLRNSLNALPPFEVVLSIVAMLVYIAGIAFVAYKMFEFGAMEYNQKVSFKDFFATLFGKKPKALIAKGV